MFLHRGSPLPINAQTVNADFFKGVSWGVTFSVPLWAIILYAIAAALR